MTTPSKSAARSAVLAVALIALAALVPACNDADNDPGAAEAVPVVTDVLITDNSLASANPTTVKLTVKLQNRGTGSSFFDDVRFTNFSASFSLFGGPGPVPPNVTGVLNTGFTPIGSTVIITLPLVAPASKPAAGSFITADIRVEGEDFSGRAINFDYQVTIEFLP